MGEKPPVAPPTVPPSYNLAILNYRYAFSVLCSLLFSQRALTMSSVLARFILSLPFCISPDASDCSLISAIKPHISQTVI